MQVVMNASILWNVTVAEEDRLRDTVAVAWEGMCDDGIEHLKVTQACSGCFETSAYQCILYSESWLLLLSESSHFAITAGSLHILSFVLLVTHQTLCTFLDHFIFYPLSYWSHIKLCAPSWITSYFIFTLLVMHTSNFVHLLGSLHILSFVLLVTHQTLCTFLDHFIFYLYLTGHAHIKLCAPSWITSYFIFTLLVMHTSNFVHLLGSLHILSFVLLVTHQTLCTFLDHFIFYPLSYWSHIKICAPSWITSYFILYLTGHTSKFVHLLGSLHVLSFILLVPTSNFVHLLGSLHILCFILPVTHQTSCTFLDHFIYQTLCTFLDHFIFDLLSYFSCTHQILCTFLDHFIF